MSLEEFLEQYSRVSAEPRLGRNMRDGYARGHGLRFGGLPDLIRSEPDYQEARSLAEGRTLLPDDRLMNLYLLIRFYIPKLKPGHIIEFGCYKGGSAVFMASLAQRYLPDTRVFGLDTFAGMPETDRKVDWHEPGNFQDTDLASLNTYIRSNGLTNLMFVKGLFEDTAEAVLRGAGSIVLAHIDCDIQSAVTYSWDSVKPHMVPGGYVAFDDATEASCLGATEAVERELIQKSGLCSEQIYPHYLFRYPPIR
ncbi:MAG: CmcI family methyltransferase [Ktedonobacterales bacterium]